MCFRPAEIQMNKCPQCGKNNKPIAKVCEGCGASLEMKKVDFDADQAKLDADNVAVPAAPAVPAPAAPKPPAPKPPAGK